MEGFPGRIPCGALMTGSVGCSRSSEADGCGPPWVRSAMAVTAAGAGRPWARWMSIRRWMPVVSRVGVGHAMLDGLEDQRG